jgi:5-methylcytosine-specific restriction endonuclease McrA
MPYEEYLRTPEWRTRRKRKLDDADHRCQFCNRHRRSLHVHHRTYENLGQERDSDLTVVCPDCHATFHKHRRLGR